MSGSVFQVVPRTLVWSQRREAAGGSRRAVHLPGPGVAVQAGRLRAVCPDQ